MKVDIIDENNIIVFLNQFFTKDMNFLDKNLLEDQFRKLFLKLKDTYNIEINGYYDINIYIDKYYGSVLEIKKEEIEYLDYFDDQIDMRIIISKYSVFLYKIIDIFEIPKNILKDSLIYKYKNNLYLELKKNIDNIEMGKLLENSFLVYGTVADKILKNGRKIKNNLNI